MIMSYTSILVETIESVGLIRLNRPKALNALNSTVMSEVVDAVRSFDDDEQIKAIVITGNDKAFAAGADIKEMVDASSVDMFLTDPIANWDAVASYSKPIIAAVSGW
jgi:enoyl-CoA hydratase